MSTIAVVNLSLQAQPGVYLPHAPVGPVGDDSIVVRLAIENGASEDCRFNGKPNLSGSDGLSSDVIIHGKGPFASVVLPPGGKHVFEMTAEESVGPGIIVGEDACLDEEAETS